MPTAGRLELFNDSLNILFCGGVYDLIAARSAWEQESLSISQFLCHKSSATKGGIAAKIRRHKRYESDRIYRASLKLVSDSGGIVTNRTIHH